MKSFLKINFREKTLHYTGKIGMHVEVESCLLSGQIFHTAGDGT